MGNHLFSATDLMSLLLSLCCALLFHSLLSSPPASLYFCVLSCPNSPQSLCKPKFRTALSLQVFSACILWIVSFFFPFLSQLSFHYVLIITATAGPQVISHIVGSFHLMFTIGHLGLQCQSMCPHIVSFCKTLRASLIRTSPLAI